jgi:hypothetical protein
MTFAQWRAEHTPDRVTVGVCFDRRLLFALEQAESELEEVTSEKDGMLGNEERKARISELEGKADKLRSEVESKTRTLVFESIGRREWSDLLAEHPPTKEQLDRFGELDHNPETFPPVALEASCVEPGMSLEDAQWLMDKLPLGAWNRVWGACLSVNVVGSRDPFEKGFDGAPVSGPK